MLLPGNESVTFTHFHDEFLQMREDGTFKFGFGEVHIGCQAQKFRHHWILDKLQLVPLISDTTFSFAGDCNSR